MVDRRHDGRTDRTGFDETKNYLSTALGRVVPRAVARRALEVSVSTDAAEYAPDEPISITVIIRNRLPVPIEVPTTTRRSWGWAVDGVLEATDKRRYIRGEESSLSFRAGETKRATATWNGRFRRTADDGGLDRSVRADRGDHTISVFVPVPGADERHEDATQIRIR
ncbi:hypothetical protein DJ83_09675 [Halorubrum ezzemoulense]|jgi:hypothetical protein|uniref:DUF7974 domain-containing protein n=2 Tax=Halorubrum ezzemoulense TaxID=337243 RepID=A0A256KUY0_HALEZ|nr:MULTISPECIES: hypothetical protein [Halorubrum]MDB2224715.1 hypothetical protein [Halorubrum ezzemoulense]MDB2242229.1 hypothetical protein [Halorubrum ezzemoulense]MDB2261431.1 hypothetical protein [Halorubrum ezzemoulense]MDB2264445.1 hypothetical protein [Halorubrum ezzemoulense]MDB2268416.1 hypothetical protein [Halorubrum ezzemoulense]